MYEYYGVMMIPVSSEEGWINYAIMKRLLRYLRWPTHSYTMVTRKLCGTRWYYSCMDTLSTLPLSWHAAARHFGDEEV